MHHQKFRHPDKEEEKPAQDLGGDKEVEEEKEQKTEEKEEKDVSEGNEGSKEEEKEPETASGSEEEAAAEEPPAKRARTDPEQGGTEDKDSTVPKEPTSYTDGPSLSVAELSGMRPVERLRKVYGVEMPPDFYEFWKFAVSVDG